MSKRIVSLLLILSLLLVGAAMGETLSRADANLDTDALSRLWSWTVSDAGDFSVVSNAAAVLQEQFAAQARSGYNAGVISFVMELRGNVKSALCYPVLKVLYVGGTKLNCTSVSIVLDGVRYDFAASRADYSGARGNAETISVYLDAEGRKVMNALSRATTASVCLLGDIQYIAKLERRDTYNPVKPRLESGSLEVLALPEGAPDFDAYGLNDLALNAHIAKGGVAPRMTSISVTEQSDIQTEATFGLIGAGSTVAQIRATQELLVKTGFYSGNITSNITPAMRNAVKRAQQYYGMLATGAADARLINLLNGKASPAPIQAPEADQWSAQSDSVAFRLDRWWVANSADTRTPGTAAKVPADTDNTLVIADGWVKSQSGSAVSLSFEASAVFKYNGKYDFAASLLCENNKGTAFSSTLGALASTRLLAYAEIPAYLMNEPGTWTLAVTVDGVTFDYALN